jgi:hypothetical protein
MLFDDPSSSPADGDAGPARPGCAQAPAGAPRLIDTAGVPAPEALGATATGAAVVRELRASGRQVRFALVPTRERVSVLLCDMDGAVLSRLSPSRALEIATGEPVPRAWLR